MAKASLPPDYFESMYAADPDPWRFATSDYERRKYAETLASLPLRPVGRIFEVGCAIGVLTAQLATRCESLYAVDVSVTALAEARARCASLANVRFAEMQVPRQWPQETFDLIVFSEVLYYLDPADIRRTAEFSVRSLNEGGSVLLVHWTGETDYPCSADDAVEIFTRATAPGLRVDHAARFAEYRLDRFSRA
jgi:cyclopropane fatty-acyl-phospholipid synthase-like methyltransferase